VIYAAIAWAAVATAAVADRLLAEDLVPHFAPETLEDLLAIIASSMLAVATLAVASMVAAYASASATATPRAFALVVADDVTQTALSGFIAAFIFSIVALTAVKTRSYGPVGLFVTFTCTILIFAMVIMLFLRWVDRIARLGRRGSTIDRVEQAARAAIDDRRRHPRLGGVTAVAPWPDGPRVHGDDIGYVQSIDMAAIQMCAETASVRVRVDALPGAFVGPGRTLASLDAHTADDAAVMRRTASAFIIGDDRTFTTAPRFGLVTLAEISGRALSPAVNDPGTAIDIIGTLVRLFARWAAPADDAVSGQFDRVAVPELSADDLFDDAFTAIARDGAFTVEVGVRLQKAFASLALVGDYPFRRAAIRHAGLALARAERALTLPHDLELVRALATAVAHIGQPGSSAPCLLVARE